MSFGIRKHGRSLYCVQSRSNARSARSGSSLNMYHSSPLPLSAPMYTRWGGGMSPGIGAVYGSARLLTRSGLLRRDRLLFLRDQMALVGLGIVALHVLKVLRPDLVPRADDHER